MIIGLLVGSIAGARIMIANADLRSGVAQLESYNQAVYAFKNKFNCLPGDCINNRAIGGLNTGYHCDNGNGDGQINDSCGGGSLLPVSDVEASASAEAWHFWYMLSSMRYIPGSYNPGQAYSMGINAAAWPISSPLTKFPSQRNAAAYDTVRVWAWFYAGSHYWAFTGGNVDGACNGYAFCMPFTPLTVSLVDVKMDDGIPGSGIVVATRQGTGYGADGSPQFNNPYTTGTPGNAGCTLTTATPNSYNITYTAQPYCNMTIKTNF